MFYAEMITEHYTFRALAATGQAAKEAIFRGWMKHHKVLDGPNGPLPRPTLCELAGLEGWYGINIYRLEMNECLRDDVVMEVK